MNLVSDALITQLGHPRRNSAGWHNFNAVCCPHQGIHRPDRGKRGFLKDDGPAVVYYCHNCGFRTGWSEGRLLGRKMEDVLTWAGMSGDKLRDLKFRIGLLKHEAEHGKRVTLPDGLKSLMDWLKEDCRDLRLLQIAAFVGDIDPPRDLNEVYWTPDDNGMALDTYIVLIKGDLSWPTGWVGMPFHDRDQPSRTHMGIDPEDDDVSAETLAEMERLLDQYPNGKDD